eukprot:gene18120-24557_t
MVDRIAERAKGSRLNFVITHYFLDYNGDKVPDQYCYMASDQTCKPFDEVGFVNSTSIVRINDLDYDHDFDLDLDLDHDLDFDHDLDLVYLFEQTLYF